MDEPSSVVVTGGNRGVGRAVAAEAVRRGHRVTIVARRVRTYAGTKLANLLMVPLFAERWKDAGVTIDAVHPGVLRTDLTTRGGAFGLLMRAVKPALKPVGRAAPPVVNLVDSAGTGRYFHLAEEKPLKPRARDGALARRLWDDAESVLATAE